MVIRVCTRAWLGIVFVASLACAGQRSVEPPTQDPSPDVEETSALDEAQRSSLLAALGSAEVCVSEGFLDDTSCPALTELLEHPRIRDGSAESFLIELVGEGREAEIWLAAHVLRSVGQRFPTSTELATALLNAADAAPADARYICELGHAVGRIVASEADLVDRMIAVVRAHPAPCIRQGVMAEVVLHQPNPMLATVREIADDGSPDDRLFAAQALAQPGVLGSAEACALWLEIAGQHDDGPEAGEFAAAQLLGCTEQRGPSIDLIEAWAKAGDIHHYGTGHVLAARYREDAVSEDERTRLRAAAKAILDHEGNNIVSRETSFKFLFEVDPDRYAIAEALSHGPKTRLWAMAGELLGYSYPHTVVAHALDSFGSVASQPVAKQVEDGAWERRWKLRGCYDAALEATPSFERSIALGYEYGEDGQLVELQGMPDDLPGELGACIDRVIRSVSIQAPEPGDRRAGTLNLRFELHKPG